MPRPFGSLIWVMAPAPSLFEIPVRYYESLPNSKRYVGELSNLVDAVIQVFRDELNKYEKPDDVELMLCSILQKQFTKMLKIHAQLVNEPKGRAKDNILVDLIFRKIKDVMEQCYVLANCDALVGQMRAAMEEA